MNSLYKDFRFRSILVANIASSIGSGITMIAIPWLLVTSENGSSLFGYITLIMTMVNFVITPSIGLLIDKWSRKSILLAGEIFGFIMLVAFAGSGLVGGAYETWHLIVLYFTGSLYYTLFYPTMFAFNQEIFEKRQYKALNGMMEVQGQLSSMIAGAVASFLMIKVELQWILLLDAFTYLIAIYYFIRIPYQRLMQEKNKEDFSGKMTAGFRFMSKKPTMFLFLIASVMPFIGVMMTNYLFPVYLSEVLKADASVYGMESMIYGMGAMIAGMLIPLVAKKIGNEKTMVLTVFCYTLFISLIIWVSLPIYLGFMFFIAIGNSGVRVARNSFMMDHIPNEIIGRIDSLFRAIGLAFRIILLIVFTNLAATGVVLSFGILSIMMILASVTIFFSWKRLWRDENVGVLGQSTTI
ncbi:MFS transporter [Peribacillus alkalitolerans]|uniref:MFS transporter n=1 Tax=Peribacillus alkalitolerans TaxID=1550385 RepID=UPI0013D496A5|nr:MFS transporter [Peribacillus alkalitolerans]